MMGDGEIKSVQVRVPDEQKLRRYLLGQALAEESEEVEKALLANADVSDLLSVLEDELTEDYVTGELNDTDRASFERLFLMTEERRMKIRLSALLLKRPDVLERIPLDTVRRAYVENLLANQRAQTLSSDDRMRGLLDAILRDRRPYEAPPDHRTALFSMSETAKVTGWRKLIVWAKLFLLRVRGSWKRIASRARSKF